MPPNRFAPDDPKEWLNRAKSNLARAKADRHLDEVYLEDLCFDAQQAAEKSMKALLITAKKDFPRTHDLAELLSLIERAGYAVPESVRSAPRLSVYSTVTRYPGVAGAVSDQDYREAVIIAEAVLVWAESTLPKE